MIRRSWIDPVHVTTVGARRTPGGVLLAVAAFGLAGCGGGPPPDEGLRNLVDTPPWETKQSTLFSGNGSLFGNGPTNRASGGDTQGLGVNAYLWRGALDTLSFMPLASADPFGGVIITDWYTPPTASEERFKANAYILGRQLRADGIKVSIFRQVQQGGNWVDAPVAPGTAADIENKVLAKARELRAQSASNP
jgi:hypothetical protein